jgi:hypothetical protein
MALGRARGFGVVIRDAVDLAERSFKLEPPLFETSNVVLMSWLSTKQVCSAGFLQLCAVHNYYLLGYPPTRLHSYFTHRIDLLDQLRDQTFGTVY